MLDFITVVFGCQLAGEVIVATTGLPVPGPVVGMAILLAGLLVRGSVPRDLGLVCDTLLGNLSLLFVPAGVGVMLHARLLAREWLPISVALLASTLAGIAVTGLVMQRLTTAASRRKDQP